MNPDASNETESAHAKIVRSAGVVSAAVLLSRITGLAREAVFAGLFGSGLAYDAFVAAFRIPNLLRDLLAEGSLSSAFVTTFSQTLSARGKSAAHDLSSQVTTLLTPLLALICLLGVIFAPQLVDLLFPGYAAIEGKKELTVLLTRIMMPFLLFIALAAKAMGVLNSSGRFGIPALASAFFNVASVGSGLVIGFVLGPRLGIEPIVGMTIGTLMGGMAQYCCQIPELRRLGLRFRPKFDFSNPALRQVLRLMGPTVIGAAAVQVNVMVNSIFASEITGPSGEAINGPVAWLSYAFRFMQLPLGLFGVAVASATLPVISRDAGSRHIAEFRETLSRSLGLVFLLTVPSAVGLVVLSRPIVGVIFQRGEFTANDTEQTALALSFYCLGLAAYAAIKTLTPAFYALDNVRAPVVVSVFSIALNYGLNHLFVERLGWGHWALALSVSLVATLNFSLLLLFMRAKIGGIGGRRLLTAVLKIGFASAVMGLGCKAVAAAVVWQWDETFFPRLLTLLIAVPLGVALLYALCRLMKLEELELAEKAVFSRMDSA